MHPTTVEVEASLQLVAPDSVTLPVRSSLRYDPTDPYAVHVLFHPDADTDADPATDEMADEQANDPVGWSFARDLLVSGLSEATGIGDVRVWPWTTPHGEVVALALSSPDGNALFEVPRSILVRFLRRTFTAVPRGEESQYLDVNAAVGKLLGQAPKAD